MGTAEEGRHRDAFDAYLVRPDAVALVAEVDGVVVGFCDLEFRRRLAFLAEQAWVPDLIVSEDHRSRGVGRALLERAEQLARDRGCFALSLESATWRTRAHAFYERAGLPATGMAFTRTLGDLEWPPPPAG